MSSYTTKSPTIYSERLTSLPESSLQPLAFLSRNWKILAAAVFLVAVPVFFQAPLVRTFPGLSLVCTGGWLTISIWLLTQPNRQLWGDLLLGFTWTWLAGSIYWGWLRWEPLLHLPIEAIGLPIAVWCLMNRWGKVGSYFYLGSLLGTVLTDVYFYLVHLIPHWRQLMQVSPDGASAIFRTALVQIQTPWGFGCAAVLVGILLIVGLLPLRSVQVHWWAFGGAVLSTLLVDGLFFLAATLA